MTAYELRRHLHQAHDVRVIGADYGTLLTVHTIEHRHSAGHTHDDPSPDTWAGECAEFGCDEAGHVNPDWLWTIALVLAIVLMLRALGVWT